MTFRKTENDSMTWIQRQDDMDVEKWHLCVVYKYRARHDLLDARINEENRRKRGK